MNHEIIYQYIYADKQARGDLIPICTIRKGGENVRFLYDLWASYKVSIKKTITIRKMKTEVVREESNNAQNNCSVFSLSAFNNLKWRQYKGK